jgi:hypothetical protein
VTRSMQKGNQTLPSKHDTNIYNDTKMLEVAGLKVTKGQKNNGIRSMYNVRADPDLGLP